MSGYENLEDRVERYKEKFGGLESVAREAPNTGQSVAAYTQALRASSTPESREALKPLLENLVLDLD